MTTPKPDPIPDSLLEILITRAKYERAKTSEIKAAYDAGDKKLVFKLVGELLYEGPGSLPREKRHSSD